MDRDTLQPQVEGRSVSLSTRRRLWQIYPSTALIALAVIALLVLMMVPGQKAMYLSGSSFSGGDLEDRANFRFHGWPAIHMVSFENYELFHSYLTRFGRRLKNGSVQITGVGAGGLNRGQTLAKGDKSNEELALKKVNEAYDEYVLNEHFWAQPSEFSEGESFFFNEPTSIYPNWMSGANWTRGMKRKMQWKGLAINISLAFAIIFVLVGALEFRRRRRRSFWQISLLEFGVLLTFVCLAAWFYANKRQAEKLVTELRSKNVVTHAYTVAEPVWLVKIVGPRFCKQYGNLALDMSRADDDDRKSLHYLRYTHPWWCKLKSFGKGDVEVVSFVPRTRHITLNLSEEWQDIDWEVVQFGSGLEELSIESFDEEAKSTSKINEKLKTEGSLLQSMVVQGITFSGLTQKNPASFNYPPISIAPFRRASKCSGKLSAVSVSGFEIGVEFVEGLSAISNLKKLSLGTCHVTEEAVEALMKLSELEMLQADFTSNLDNDQIQRLYSRHKKPAE